MSDGLARLLAFRFAVPAVGSESEWREKLTEAQREDWRAEAQMVEGYLVNAEGWARP